MKEEFNFKPYDDFLFSQDMSNIEIGLIMLLKKFPFYECSCEELVKLERYTNSIVNYQSDINHKTYIRWNRNFERIIGRAKKSKKRFSNRHYMKCKWLIEQHEKEEKEKYSISNES